MLANVVFPSGSPTSFSSSRQNPVVVESLQIQQQWRREGLDLCRPALSFRRFKPGPGLRLSLKCTASKKKLINLYQELKFKSESEEVVDIQPNNKYLTPIDPADDFLRVAVKNPPVALLTVFMGVWLLKRQLWFLRGMLMGGWPSYLCMFFWESKTMRSVLKLQNQPLRHYTIFSPLQIIVSHLIHVVLDTILLSALRNRAIALIVMGVFLLMLHLLSVWATSPGRMGGWIYPNCYGPWQVTSVLKLQVGLLCQKTMSLQRDLNHLGVTSRTSVPVGLHHVLTESASALLRHPDCCISAYSCADVKRNMREAKALLDQYSIEEQAKFEEEPLVNVNMMKEKRPASMRACEFNNEYMVVTILVAVKEAHDLPSIKGSKDLKDALQNLRSIPCSRTRGVEVLWTEKELLVDYPLLKPL